MSCTRTQHGASRETKTNDPFISSRALYHWLALQVLYSYWVTETPRGMRCPGLMEIGTHLLAWLDSDPKAD